MRLHVLEGERRRAFRLGEGHLSIGSAPAARLRLDSPEVAPLHARLEVGPAGCRLVREPGVVAPEIDGAPMVPEALALAPGRKVRIGGALLWIEREGDDPEPAGRTSASRPAPPRPSAVQRRPAERKAGLPGWAISALVVSALGAVLLVLWRAALFGAAQAGPEAEARLAAAESFFEKGELEAAEARLALAQREGLDPAEAERARELRGRIEAVRAEAALAARNREGAKLLEWLQSYEAETLAGAPEAFQVRLFLKRAKRFREEYPEHPELAWLDRVESRFAGLVDLDQPADWQATRWELRSLTRKLPRDYAQAFALLDAFLARTPEGLERDEAARYRRLLEGERREHHAERLEEASRLYEAGQEGKSVAVLVSQIQHVGDEELAAEAAGVLIRMPEAYLRLQGYRDHEPAVFARLLEEPLVATFFRAKELGN